MQGKLINIKNINEQSLPRFVKIIIGAPKELVSRRETVHTYQVNREIKYWATWHLLKMFTDSGYIQYWHQQKERLLAFLQMNENTFRHHLKQLEKMGLLHMQPHSKGFSLINYPDAAKILGIEYNGTYAVTYDYTQPCINPDGKRQPAKQSFQYILRAEEFEVEKDKQLNKIMSIMDENPEFFNRVIPLLGRYGADMRRLADADYLQQRLLQLQITLFKEGSDLLEWTYNYVRADINRGVKKIRDHHGYRAAQSASYLKKKMWRLGIISVTKHCIKSLKRARLYFADEETGEEREGYKWLPKEKCTALFLTDQITPNYESSITSSWGRQVRQTA